MTHVVKSIVCLANSRHLGGRCVAGRVLELEARKIKEWIRPVSDRENKEVSAKEQEYEDGRDLKILDIIDIPFLSPQPHGHQTENYLFAPNTTWNKRGTFPLEHLDRLVDSMSDLWTMGANSSNGLNDEVSLAGASHLQNSLRFITLPKLTISVFNTFFAGSSTRRVQARFTHNSQYYHLWVTDPMYETKYQQMKDGNYEIGPCYATISLPKPMPSGARKGYSYKIVAAIIEKPAQ